MPHKRDENADIRSRIAGMLTGRCNNCYDRLPGPVGCSVHSPGWNWATPNLGPFCDECYKPIARYKAALKEIATGETCWERAELINCAADALMEDP